MIGFTGTRKVSHSKVLFVIDRLAEIANSELDEANSQKWLVGDAAGIDALVANAAEYHEKECEIFKVEGNARYEFAKRSKRMIDVLRQDESVLIAFPDKDCPRKCTPQHPDGCGSGTWLTCAYAAKFDIPIFFYPLYQIELPEWTKSKQLLIF
jgi:hypothetical protein